MNHTRVLVMDDHAVVHQGIQMFLDTDPSVKIAGEAEDGQEALRKAKSLQPDVVRIDLVMPRADGIEAIAEIKRNIPGVKIIVLTTFENEGRVHAAMEAGADARKNPAASGGVIAPQSPTRRPLHIDWPSLPQLSISA